MSRVGAGSFISTVASKARDFGVQEMSALRESRCNNMSSNSRIRTSLARAGAAGAMLLAAGCAGAPIIGNRYYDSGYASLEYRAQGDLPVIVYGDPFPVPQSEFDQNVASALQGTTFGTATTFVPASRDETVPYRVIMDFEGLGTGESLCAEQGSSSTAPKSSSPAGRVNLSAVLCRDDRALSYAIGSVATEGGPGGPDFRNGVSQFGMALFPPRRSLARPGTS